jgi:hypothetical protein
MTMTMKEALHHISLASQNSMSSKDECGRIAREALAAEEAREKKSWQEERAEEQERNREHHALVKRDFDQRFAMNERLTEETRHAQAFRDFHREQAARQTAALEAIAATLIRLTTKEKP